MAAINHDDRLNPERLTTLLDDRGVGPVLAPVLDATAELFAVARAAKDAVRLACHDRWARVATRIEVSDGGGRYLYSCLSGSPRHWTRGLRALLLPDDQDFADEGRKRPENWRRILERSTEMMRPSLYR